MLAKVLTPRLDDEGLDEPFRCREIAEQAPSERAGASAMPLDQSHRVGERDTSSPGTSYITVTSTGPSVGWGTMVTVGSSVGSHAKVEPAGRAEQPSPTGEQGQHQDTRGDEMRAGEADLGQRAPRPRCRGRLAPASTSMYRPMPRARTHSGSAENAATPVLVECGCPRQPGDQHRQTDGPGHAAGADDEQGSGKCTEDPSIELIVMKAFVEPRAHHAPPAAPMPKQPSSTP